VVQKTVATGNTLDGIDTDDADTVVKANSANGNGQFDGQLGIEAVSAANDGGANSAHGNRDPDECSAVIACA
jgi:hypothetical protein